MIENITTEYIKMYNPIYARDEDRLRVILFNCRYLCLLIRGASLMTSSNVKKTVEFPVKPDQRLPFPLNIIRGAED